MQTIDNSLLQVSVDENGAQMNHLVKLADNFDYLQDREGQEHVTVAFPALGHDDNWALKLPWTVVDKGDARVSLTLIDTPESYKKFPYHFEVMVTYAIEGNQLNVSFYLKNNSNKDMPFSLGFLMPLSQEWQAQTELNKLVLTGPENHSGELTSTDFKLQFADQKADCVCETTLNKESDRTFKLSFTIA